MQDNVDSLTRLGCCGCVAEVDLAEVDLAGKFVDIRLQAGVEIVEAADLVSLTDQGVREV